MRELLQDVKYAFRWLTRNRGFAAIAVLLLGLGLGGGAMAFGVLEAVLLRPLPYDTPGRLALLWEGLPGAGYDQLRISGPEYVDYREQAGSFTDVAAFRFLDLTVTGSEEPFVLEGIGATGNLFSVLGSAARLGRTFDVEEGRGGKPQAVLSHGLWRQRFAADPRILGKPLTLNGEPHTIVGVMPETFRFPPPFTLGGRHYSPTAGAEIFVLLPPDGLGLHREQRSLMVLARLREGVAVRQADQELQSLARRLREQYPDDNPGGLTAFLAPLEEQAVGRVRPTLFLLAAAVGLVLVIACANLASLLVARAAARDKEMALRAALGADRRRLARQLLTESLVLGLAGAALGLLLTVWAADAVSKLDVQWIPRLNEVRLDGMSLGFVLLLAVGTSLLFGLAPVLYLARPDLARGLHATAKGVSTSGRTIRLQRRFVALQLAFSLILLTASGLVGLSFWRLGTTDLGFAPDDLLAVSLSFPEHRYPERARVKPALAEILRRVEDLPEVESASAASGLPLTALLDSASFTIEGREPPASPEEQMAVLTYVTRDYFQTLGMRLLDGRLFETLDETEEPRGVVINQSMARASWPGQEAVGRRIVLSEEISAQPLTVIGVVNDVKVRGLEGEAESVIYLPFAASYGRRAVLIVKPRAPGSTIGPEVRSATWSLDPELPLQTSTMEERVEASYAQPRLAVVLLGILTGLAVFLAVTGNYAAVSFFTVQRHHEIGIRIAVGANRNEVVWMLVKSGLRMILLGLAVGLLGVLVAYRLGAAFVHDLGRGGDLWTLAAAAAAFVFGVGLASVYLAARRATPADPLPLLGSP